MRRLRRAHQRQAREQAKRRKKFKQRAVAAGTAAVITLGAGVSLNKALAHTPDEHELAVSQDADADLLANKEELAIGYQVFKPDQNRNEIPDGVELAKRCAADINELPWQGEAFPGETYKWWMLAFGLETCDICGTQVNMGSAGIVNPRLGLSVDCPLIAIHYMEHGSLSYAGDVHNGRLDVAALLRALEIQYPYEPNEHQLPLYTDDLDGDLLADSEELAAGFDLYNSDQDGDLNPDGIELAKQCAAVISQLPFGPDQNDPNKPYIEHFPQRGIETCDICGATVNMGPASIVNPKLNLTVDCPLIAMHYLEHGSFSHAGNVHTGRVDVPLLLKILEMPRRCGDLGTMYRPSDLNRDCKIDFVDFATLADKWLQSTDPNDDSSIEY